MNLSSVFDSVDIVCDDCVRNVALTGKYKKK